jgi:hypothetical protein
LRSFNKLPDAFGAREKDACQLSAFCADAVKSL